MDTISRIRSLQTKLNDEDLNIPKMRREVTNSNLKWLLRNINVLNNSAHVENIKIKIKQLLKEFRLKETPWNDTMYLKKLILVRL